MGHFISTPANPYEAILSEKAKNFLHSRRPNLYPLKKDSYYAILYGAIDVSNKYPNVVGMSVYQGSAFASSFAEKPCFRII